MDHVNGYSCICPSTATGTHCERGKASMYRIKSEELYILSCGKGLGRRPWPFSQLRM